MDAIVSWFIAHNAVAIGSVGAGLLWEYWLGKNNWKSNSTVELALRILNSLTGKLLSNIDAVRAAQAPVSLKAADEAAGMKK